MRVNVEQASKRAMWEPTRLRYGEGRGGKLSPPDHKAEDRAMQTFPSHRGSDDGMCARGIDRQHGKP